MKIKKLMSLGLASVMMSSMIISASATAPQDITGITVSAGKTATTEVSSSVNIPTISVVIPLADTVVLNPYEMSYTAPGGAAPSTDQVVHAVNFIQNMSSANIKVSYTAVAAVSSDDISYQAVPSSDSASVTAIKGDTETKQVGMEIKTAPLGDSDPSAFATAIGAGKTDGTDFYTGTVTTAASDFIMCVADPTVTSVEVEARDASDNTKTQFLGYQISGFASKPATWTADDKVDVSIAWTFGF